MQAGEIGFPIQIYPNPEGSTVETAPFILTGQTCTLHVQNLFTGYDASFLMDVQPDGLSAIYTTQSSADFPLGGYNYNLEMFFTQPGGQLRKTPIGVVYVGETIDS